MKIVVDNKIWVAYLLSKEPKVEKLIKLINKGDLTLLLSKEVLGDLADLLKLAPVSKLLDKKLIESFINLLVQKSTIIKVNALVEGKTSQKDQPYAELAIDGKAQFLITPKSEFSRFEKLDGYKLINVIELKNFINNFEV